MLFLQKISFLFIFFVGFSTQAAPTLQPTKLRCEYLDNPLGIDETKPRLSWNFVATQNNQSQTAYELIVSNNLTAIQQQKGNVWQTEKVASNQNLHVEYQGIALQSFTKYYWCVKVYDANGEASAWSAVATFETALLNPSDWQGHWIGDNQKQFEKDEDFYQKDPMPLFRKELSIGKKIASARLYVSGLGYYEAYLNNVKIGNSVLEPGFTAYRKQVFYSTYDITSQLKKGQNTFGIMLGNGWWNALPLRLFGRFNFRDVQQTGRPCVRAQILIRYTDGTQETVATDDSWQTTKGPIVRNNVYLGEEYDARLEKSFDTPNGWQNATLVQGPSGALTAQMMPPIKITKTIQPVGIQEVGKDTFVVDMGQNFAGVLRIKVQGAAGTTVCLRYGEDVYASGKVNFMTSIAGQIKEVWNLKGGPGAPKTAWQRGQYTLKGQGLEVWNARFAFHGFRYVEITGWPGKPTLADIEGLRMNSDLPQNGAFACSNPMFNKLHDVIQRTFLSNVFSVQSDCPAREKMGYGGDLVATADAFSYNYDMAQFYAKTVRDFANDQQPDGGITEIAPYTGIADRGYGGESGPMGWQLAFSFLQKKLYDFYGDKRIIKQQYPNFKKQMKFLESKAIDGLFHWDISDHEALDPRPEAFSASCFYYHHALLAAEFATILNKKQDADQYTALAKKIRDLIVRKYHVPKTGRFDNATQSAQIFALYYDLLPQNELIMKKLMDEYARHDWHISTGIFTTKMAFDVLRQADQNGVAYRIANQKTYPSWGNMLEKGATTLWETWAYPDVAASQNHPMFGSIDEWFYRSLLGINALEAGFKKIQIKPQVVEDLTWAKGSYQSVYGEIGSDWKRENGQFVLNVTIPVNTTAEVWVPSGENDAVVPLSVPLSVSSQTTESKLSVKTQTTAQTTAIRFEKGYSVFAVGSGSYRFVAKHSK
ncbi:MAG: alpha-L-rhamnosidase [Cytophagia bacterium]|nr:MAG: alpha-L-rhamnosidase [Cytophagales bacterium]TAG41251.1 MAG: alpha-L-rhamnosidase [Cytophagia bacterium]TAG82936.1 MAG: alpha-L-rhamnosidase [Cytophagales bacterium]